jgi:hypothetical protein
MITSTQQRHEEVNATMELTQEGRLDIGPEVGCPVRVIKWGKPMGDGDGVLITMKLFSGIEIKEDEATVSEDAQGDKIVQLRVPLPDGDDAPINTVAIFTAKLADMFDSQPGFSAEVVKEGAIKVSDDNLATVFGVQFVALGNTPKTEGEA